MFKLLKESIQINSKLIFHLSQKDLDGSTLYPRIPDNYMTQNGFEDCKTKRISFSKSIDGALIGISANLKNKEFFVYQPIKENVKIQNITNKEVPDALLTGEIWVIEPIKIKKICKIRIIEALEPPLKYTYGNHIAETYAWKWVLIK